jgi:phosphate starvation-inducible PhoH-like protein
MACGKAVELLRAGKVSRVVITRPLQECGEETGILPGDLWEKIVDMMAPLLDALDEFLGPGELEQMRHAGLVQVIPLAKMRGRTLKDSFVILDEAQNATFAQLKMFLTRFGSKCKMVVCGDHTQSDLPYKGTNSLLETVGRFEADLHRDVRVVRFGEADIVRDELVRWFARVMGEPAGRDGGYDYEPPLTYPYLPNGSSR